MDHDAKTSSEDASADTTAEITSAEPPLVMAKVREPAFPFSNWYPFLAGIASGLLLRLLYSGKSGSTWSAMAGAFIYVAPMLVGAVTVYVAETIKRRNWAYYFEAPFIANLIFIMGTLVIMVEGLICAIVIVPLFAMLGSLGGLAMGAICRITNWPKQAVLSLALLPIALGVGGDYLPTPDVFSSVERSVVIQAPPAQVWQQLNNARDIQPAEFGGTWAAYIGVPMPRSGVTQVNVNAQGVSERVRNSLWDKAVHFDEPITDWQPERYMRWTYRFDATSFPTHALDDHVMIGGHYFDIHDTSFTLTPVATGTRLDVQTHYRVSTQFNFYADAVAQLLMGDMLETDLVFYKRRSEAAQAKLQ
jgi:uncharacterized protein YndB with AHSA1/START domain